MSRASKLFGATASKRPDTENKCHYPAFSLPLKEQFLQVLLCNMVGNTHYASSGELASTTSAVHKAMLYKDAEFAAKALRYARTAGHMRLQPIYGLAQLARKDIGLFSSIFNDIVLTPGDLMDFMSIFGVKNTGGRAVKRVIASWLHNRMTEYWAIKYGAEKSGGYTLRDIIRVTHPKTNNPSVSYLMGEAVDLSSLPQLEAFIRLKCAQSTEEKVAAIKDGKLPHEVVTPFADCKEVWDALVPNLPVMALLKNLATLERRTNIRDHEDSICKVFSNPDVIASSRILPFRFYKAYEKVQSPAIRDALKDAIDLSTINVDEIMGKTAVFLDTSGSMINPISTASLFAYSVMYKTCGNSNRLIRFDSDAGNLEFSRRESILGQALRVRADGCSTDTSAPFKLLSEQGEKVDNIILITDEQQNSGTPMYQSWDRYRNKLNRDAKLFIVDVSPYQSGSVDIEDKNVYYIFGWSEAVLSVISMVSRGLEVPL